MAGTDSHWENLYKLGGVASIVLLVYSLVTMLIMVVLGTPPPTAAEIFAMLQANRLAGLLRLDVLTTLVVPLYYLLFAGFYAALKKTGEASVKIALLLGCAGLTLFLASPSFTSWLVLSDKFAAATSEAQKTLLLAAGETILATDLWHGSGALVGGLLLQIGLVLVSVVMLRGSLFSRLTGWVGLVTHSLDLCHLLVGIFSQRAARS